MPADLPAPAPADPPRLTPTVAIRLAGWFLLSRALVLAAAALSRTILVPGPWAIHTLSHSWLGRFLLWDAGWYVGIAQSGYSYDPHGESSAAFYPLYPLLIRTASTLGMDPVLAGYLISHLALAGACALLWRLAALETGQARIADRAVVFLLFCPGAVWFGMIYTESLFLLTVLGCLLAARQARWLAAGLWGLAAALTRTPGLLLAGFLFLEAGQQWFAARRRQTDGPPAARPLAAALWRPALAVLGPILGQASFLIYQQAALGDWRAQQQTAAHGWHTGGIRLPWVALADAWTSVEPFYLALSLPLLGVVLLAGTASFFTLRRVGYGALTLALAALYVSGASNDALPRYLCTTVPVYLVLAQGAERSPLLETAVLVFSAGLLTLLTALLVNGYRII